MIKVSAKIIFEPEHVTKKHSLQGGWKTVATALLHDDTTKYYAWFIHKRFGLKLNKPLRGPHVTFISDRTDSIKNLDAIRQIWDNQTVEINLDTFIRTNGKHWWLKVYSYAFGFIRHSLGLGKPFFSYHLTIGQPKECDLEDSEYFYRILLNENM